MAAIESHRRNSNPYTMLFCAALVLVGLAAEAASAADLVITNARLFRGTDAGVTEQANIVVSGERIQSISLGAVDTSGAEVIDATGKMVLPGLIDAHVHHFFDFPPFGDDSSESQVYFPKSESEARAYIEGRLQEKLEAYLEQGFTSILSPIDFWPHILDVREQLASGALRGPRLFAAGGVFTSPGSHPICEGQAWCSEHLSAQIGGADEARDWVRRFAESGVDLIAHDNLSNPPKLEPDVIIAMIDEAHQHGLPVFLTASDASDVNDFVAWGIDGFLHPPARTRDVDGSLLAGAGEQQLPIAITLGGTEEMYRFSSASDGQLEDYKIRRQNVITLLEHGAVPVFGSDLGDKRGTTPRDIIRIATTAMAGVGLTREEVLQAATRNAAQVLLGQEDLGTLEPGHLADIIIVNGDPLVDLEALVNVEIVIKGGEVVVDKR